MSETSGSRRPSLREEGRLWRAGHRVVAGVDEVGRGAWAGPVTVGVAVVRTGARTRGMPPWLRDSKMLSEERRESIFEEVGGWCTDWATGHSSASECDDWGMTVALRVAGLRALAALPCIPDALLLDGPYNYLEGDLPLSAACTPLGPSGAAGLPPVVPIVDGDARCAAVAAASVLAKVVRDRLMRDEAEHFPLYHFERNKGYPSLRHRTALCGYGLSAIHRRSWAFVEGLPWR